MCSGRSSDFRFILLPRLPISPMETVALLRDLSPGTAAGPFRHQTGFPFHPLIRTPEAMWTPIYPPPSVKSSREWRGHGENRPFARGCAPTVGEAQGERKPYCDSNRQYIIPPPSLRTTVRLPACSIRRSSPPLNYTICMPSILPREATRSWTDLNNRCIANRERRHSAWKPSKQQLGRQRGLGGRRAYAHCPISRSTCRSH